MRSFCTSRVLATLSMAVILVGTARAQVSFFADFDGPNAVPGPEVNDPANWEILAPGQVLAVEDHPTNGTQALKITVEGCGTSGMFMMPGVDDFEDGIIQIEMNAGDDDSFGVVFRRSADDAGYLVFFGTIETPAVIVVDLLTCGAQGQCFDQLACENNEGNTLAQEPHGMVIGLGNNTDTLGRVEVTGNRIQVWYTLIEDVADPMADDLGIPPLVDITDDQFSAPGAAGLWHESQSNSYYDNVWLTGNTGLAVDAASKATVTWAHMKRR